MVNTPDAPSGNQTNFISAAGDSVTVPDAKLMFTGDYSRSGENLVLSGDDGSSLVIGGYFASETPATLVSPSGSILTGDVVQSLAGPMFPGQYAQAGTPEGSQPIGTVVSLSGTASAKRASGVDVELKSGDPVFQGDVIQTGANSAVGLSFADKSVFNMSADARMVLNEFVYDAGGSSNKMLFNFVEGTFSFVSGQVAPSGDMKVQTPVAVMAIRGTAPVADINLNQGTINFYLGVLPGKPPGSYNLEDFQGNLLVVVNDPSKGVTLTSAGGTPQVFEVTGENLIFLQNLTQQLLGTIEQSQSGPEESPENLLKKITGSPFFDQFDGFDGLGPDGSGPSGSTPLVTIPLPQPITFPGSDTQQDAFVVLSVQVVPPAPDPDVVEPPTLVVAGDVDPDGTLTVKEDASATIAVNVAAAAGSNDVISQIVISGLDPNAAYMINGIELEPGVTTFTLVPPEAGDFGATETVTIEVLSGEDSDVDLSDLTVTATAQDGNSPNLTADASVTVPIVVDAVLDEFLVLTGDGPGFETITVNGTENEGVPVPLGLSAMLEDPEFGGLVQSDPDGDGSEIVTMTVMVSEGGVLAFIDLAELGIEVDASVPGQWTFTGTTQSDWQTLAQSFAIDPDDEFGEGQITASFSIQTQEVNTPEGEAPASGGEPDVADNTINANLTVTVNFEVADSPTFALSGDVNSNGTLTVKEDGTGTIIVDVATAAASDDVISEIVISGLDPSASYVINGHEFSSEDTTFTLPVPEGGFGTDETVTILVTPDEDSDVDLSSLTVTATTQDSDAPDVTSAGSVTVPIVVDAVLDEFLDLAVTPPNFYELLFGDGEYAYQGEYGSAPDGVELDSIPLGITAAIKDAGFLGSLEGGTDNDNSEQVAMTVAISAGAILMFTDVQALGIQVDTSVEGEWTFTGTTQSDWNTLVESFAVTPSDGFIDGDITATFSVQTQEANTPEGTVAASGGETNVADNTKDVDLTLTLNIEPKGGEELVGLDGEGEQIRLAFFSDQRANPDNFDYDQGGTTVNGTDRDAEWEDILGGGDLDFNDVQFNVEVSTPDDGVLDPTTDFNVSEGDLVYRLPTDSLVTIEIDNLLSNAGFDTTVGFYVADENGVPLEGYILFPDANEPATNSAEFTIDTSNLDSSAVLLGFFIIPDGATQNDLTGVQHVEFVNGDLGGFVAVDTSDFVVTASTDQGVVWQFDSQTYEYVNDLSNSFELPVIAGTDAENALTGGQFGELIVGFAGQDTLTGNGGGDLFVLTDLSIHDLITDFVEQTEANEGQYDVIDVGSFSFSLAAGQLDDGALDEFVKYISPSDAADGEGTAGDLFIDVDGADGPADFTLVAQLQNTPDSVTIQVDDGQGATNEVVIA